MSHADEARGALLQALAEAFGPTVTAGADLFAAKKAVMAADDIEPAMQGALTMLLAMERLKDAATEAEKSIRTALSAAIQDTGAPEVITLHHKAYLSRKAAWVSVDQQDMVPPEFFNPPTPDKKAIKAAIEAGQDVPGCSIVRPNDTSLVVRSRK
jgi:hypothetical protein